MVFIRLQPIRGTKDEEPFNHYVQGLTFLAKNDIHLKCELNAFDFFFQAFKSALRSSGDWNGSEDLKAVVRRQFKIADYDNINLYIDIGLQMDASPTKQPTIPVTLTEVFGMKLFCDVYLVILAKAKLKKLKRGDKSKK